MDQEQTQALSAIATLLLEMTARQMATFALLKEQQGIESSPLILPCHGVHILNLNNYSVKYIITFSGGSSPAMRMILSGLYPF
jgi:hypothetical protein